MSDSSERTQPPGSGADQRRIAQTPPVRSGWQARGVEDVYFQREAQITWWTVLGGIAVGALLTQLGSVLEQIQAGRWTLLPFALATALVLALSWLQTSWGTLVLRWPLTVVSSLLGFMSGFAQCILSLQAANPPGWLLAAAFVAASSVSVQAYFARSGAWVAFPAQHIARFKVMIWVHGIFGGVSLCGGILLLRFPGLLHEAVWGFLALVMTVAALILQDKGMKDEKRLLHIE